MKNKVFQVKIENEKKTILANYGQNLLDLLRDKGFFVLSHCQGTGKCGKCLVEVDGVETLSCQYKISKDISVKIPKEEEIVSFSDFRLEKKYDGNPLLVALDIGTTVINIAVLEKGKENAIEFISINNPQIKFGSDVISRIEYASKGGQKILEDALLNSINKELDRVSKKYKNRIEVLAVAANTVMLHFFFKEEVKSMGKHPYIAKFLGFREEPGVKLGFNFVDKIIVLPSINSFVGADIVSGLSILPIPKEGKYNLLIDLGTNAEIAIYDNKAYLSTSSSAGPCFEGGHISCGMSATKGAIYSFSQKGGIVDCKVVQSNYHSNEKTEKNDVIPKGLCGTGLIDVIANLYDAGAIDKTGLIKGANSYALMRGIYLTQQDVREFQLAKAAIRAGINVLFEEMIAEESKIDTVFLSGGISSRISIDSAIKSTLLPPSFYDKVQSIPNSSLLGLINYLKTSKYIDPKGLIYYIDLASHPRFQSNFIKYINFA